MFKTIVITLFMLFLVSCSQPPIDNTPVWSKNNRFAIEQIVDCNISKHSIGVIGCSFKEGNINGQLQLPPLLNGRLSFESSNCRDFTVNASRKTNYFNFSDLYTNNYGESCSFEITRTIDAIGDYPFDQVLIGRLFIKILPNHSYYKNLEFSVNGYKYSGVGQHQLKFNQREPAITVYPVSSKGIWRLYCDEYEVMKIDYTTTPFTVKFENNEVLRDCDYEMVATNELSSKIEYATYVHTVQKYTVDITKPVTYVKDGKRCFSFRDKNSDNKYVVYAVEVNNSYNIKTNYKCVTDNVNSYTVKGYTMNGRVFWGSYNSENNTWEVK